MVKEVGERLNAPHSFWDGLLDFLLTADQWAAQLSYAFPAAKWETPWRQRVFGYYTSSFFFFFSQMSNIFSMCKWNKDFCEQQETNAWEGHRSNATACSNLCLAVICCYAPKQVAEKGKYKFYQSSMWKEAPAHEAVVKVKAGNVEDESRNNKQKNTLGHVGLGGVELVRSWEVAVRCIVWSPVAFGSLTDLQEVTSWSHTKTDGPHDCLQKAQQSHSWVWKSIAMLKGSHNHELLIGKTIKHIKAQGKDGWHWS